MELIQLVSGDGFQFDCWKSKTAKVNRGSVVVLQEIFGVNHHIQTVCDRLAGEGYDAYAPALFDRMQPRFTSGYSPTEITDALKFLPKVNWDELVMDTLSTLRHAELKGGPVAVMGFCLGASVAYIAAQRDPGFAAVVGYYGGQITRHLNAPPQSPTLLHYGETDHTIPMSDVARIKTERPECTLHVYKAGHGFNCDERASYEPASADLAWKRSMHWLSLHMG
jgi:carboxymethylenebutenolidase